MAVFIDYFANFLAFIRDVFSEYYSFVILTATGIVFVIGVFIFISIRQRLNLYRRAFRSYSKGRKQRALLLLSIEIGRNPTNRKAILLRANIENELGLHSLAEKDYKTLLALKIPGDEIDVLEIKKSLLNSLYEQRKQLEVFMLADEILSERRLDSDALYYLGAVFAEQMKFVDAEKILEYVVKNRPGMKQAYFMLALVESQIGKFGRAIECIKKAQFPGPNEDNSDKVNPDCFLIEVSLYFFEKNYSKALDLIDALKKQNMYPFFSKKNLFLMRLEGFCNYFLEDLERAGQVFSRIYRRLSGYTPEKVRYRGKAGVYSGGVYSEVGYSPERKRISFKKDTYLNEYFRLKEVLADSGLYLNPNSASIFSGTGLLGLEGLTYTTWAGIDYAFCLVKQEKHYDAIKLLSALKTDHPELIGLKNLIALIKEKFSDKSSIDLKKEEDIPGKISEKVIKKAGRRYELWEYIEEWEKNAIRPFHIFALMGLVPKRQLNPILLFRVMGKLKSEIEKSG